MIEQCTSACKGKKKTSFETLVTEIKKVQNEIKEEFPAVSRNNMIEAKLPSRGRSLSEDRIKVVDTKPDEPIPVASTLDERFEIYLSENIGDPKKNKKDNKDSELLTFEYFISIYKTSLIWNRIYFQQKKIELVSKRRQALNKKDMKEYLAIINQIADEDEVTLQKVIDKILYNKELSNRYFQENLSMHMEDSKNIDAIKQVQEEASVDKGEGLATLMERQKYLERKASKSVKETIMLQKTYQDLSLVLIKALKDSMYDS